MIIGLDCSSSCVGWAVLNGQRDLVLVGHVDRIGGLGQINDFVATAARRIQVSLATPAELEQAIVAIEINAFPKAIKSAKGARSYRLCRWTEGRLLQALGIPIPLEIQASAEKKPKRRARMELKYADGILEMGKWRTQANEKQARFLERWGRRSLLTEDEIDALAVADSAFLLGIYD